MIKKLVIARRNAGFGDNLMNAANAWLFAKKSNRALVIGWYKSIYLESHMWENAFYYFFNLPDNLHGVPIIRNNSLPFLVGRSIVQFKELAAKLFGGGIERFKEQSHQKQIDIVTGLREARSSILNLDTCLGPNVVDSSQLIPFFQALTLRKDLEQKVDFFSEKYFAGKKAIGIHIRYYPSHLFQSNYSKNWLNEEIEMQRIERAIEKELMHVKEEYVVFLCTDSPDIQRHFQGKFKNLVVFFEFKNGERDPQKELHTSNISLETAENSLVEMFLLSKCDTIIRNTQSWFSFYATLKVKHIIDLSDLGVLDSNE
jgi:hypothetical protein